MTTFTAPTHQHRNGHEIRKPSKPIVTPISTLSIPIQDRKLCNFNPPSPIALAILARPRVRLSRAFAHR